MTMTLIATTCVWWVGGCKRTPGASAGAGSGGSETTTLQVMAAASLGESFEEIGAAFERTTPGVRVRFNFAGSNQLRTQLEHGSPGDVFASADRRQMDLAAAASVVEIGTVRVFARNRLAILLPKAASGGGGSAAEVKGLADLGRSGLRLVVADVAVPLGAATMRMLEAAGADSTFGPGFVAKVEANIASREENVAAVVAKVALGEADAGIAYWSDATGTRAAKVNAIGVPETLDQVAGYAVAVVAKSPRRGAATKFVEFLSVEEAQGILASHGFMGPKAEAPLGGAAATGKP